MSLVSDALDNLKMELHELLALAIRHGDEFEFPKPASSVLQLSSIIGLLYGHLPGQLDGILIEVGRLVHGLAQQLEAEREHWPHADECIAVCQRIQSYAPYDGF